MLYHLVAGEPPFRAQGVGELIGMHLYEAPEPLGARTPGAPAELVQLVHAMMEKLPARRPTMEEVARQLTRLAQPAGLGLRSSGACSAHEAPPGERARPGLVSTTHGTGERIHPPPRRRLPWYLGALAALAGCVSVALLLSPRSPSWRTDRAGPAQARSSPPGEGGGAAPQADRAAAQDLALADPYLPDLAEPDLALAAEPAPRPQAPQTRPSVRKRRKDIVNEQVPFVR